MGIPPLEFDTIHQMAISATLSRRDLLRSTALLAVPAAAMPRPLLLSIFSKHLQFVKDEELATTARDIGFEGVDLTVRPGGHVLPATVETDLPRLVEIIRKRGLEVQMVTTDIAAIDPVSEKVLRTLARLGIRYYRWGGLKYNEAQSPQDQIASLKPKIMKLAELNQKLGLCGMYHTHSGAGQLGNGFWDLHMLFEGMPKDAIGTNYDIGHATIEGGAGGWITSTRMNLAGGMKGIAVKDFIWKQGPKGWEAKWAPLGEGMVKIPQFLAMVAKSNFSGPVQVHYEYPLGGADKGATTLTMERAAVITAMRKDLVQLRTWMADVKLR